MLLTISELCDKYPDVTPCRQAINTWSRRYPDFPKVKGKKLVYSQMAQLFDEDEVLAWIKKHDTEPRKRKKYKTNTELEMQSSLDNKLVLRFLCGGKIPNITAGVGVLDWGKE